MKAAERIVIVATFVILFGGAAWIYFAVQADRQELRDAVASGEYEIRPEPEVEETVEEAQWEAIYPDTIPVVIGSTTVRASVADTLAKRIQGLSDTPFLPENVVKLFAFGVPGSHSIWMKDMNYALDIMWVAEAGEIVHIEENVSPDTFPTSFASPIPAWYVIEANAGFVQQNNIQLGDELVLPEN